jgi:hypothetical protein
VHIRPRAVDGAEVAVALGPDVLAVPLVDAAAVVGLGDRADRVDLDDLLLLDGSWSVSLRAVQTWS